MTARSEPALQGRQRQVTLNSFTSLHRVLKHLVQRHGAVVGIAAFASRLIASSMAVTLIPCLSPPVFGAVSALSSSATDPRAVAVRARSGGLSRSAR